jgi:hypothetical protein
MRARTGLISAIVCAGVLATLPAERTVGRHAEQAPTASAAPDPTVLELLFTYGSEKKS